MPIIRSNAVPATRPAAPAVIARQPVPRERAAVSRGDSHPTRDVQEAESHVAHEDSPVLAWSRPTSLDAPDARAGYRQRWVRDPINADAGDTNWLMSYREGWRPRSPSTIPGVEAYFKGKSSQGHDIVRVGNLVLCEMPIAVWQQRKAHYDGLTQQQTATRSRSEDTAANSAGRGHGFGEIKHEDQISTSRGRAAPVMTD